MSIYFDFKTINQIIEEQKESLECMNRDTKVDTSKFTPDDWIRYVYPIVNYSLIEDGKGVSDQKSYEKVVLLGVLVGLGKTPQEAINQLRQWQSTGESKILKSADGNIDVVNPTSNNTPSSSNTTTSQSRNTIATSSNYGIGGYINNSNIEIRDRLYFD